MRALSIALVVVIAAGAAWGSARLVWDLLHGAPQTTVPKELLIAGAGVAADRARVRLSVLGTRRRWTRDPASSATGPSRSGVSPAVGPRLAAPGWRPIFVDYLYLALTNATAFSPTDVMPLARWVKLTMSVQSLLSIVILSLVVANAVNLLS